VDPRPSPTRWELVTRRDGPARALPFDAVAGLRSVIADVEDPRSNLRAMLRSVRDT
jgi:hypothetical protein